MRSTSPYVHAVGIGLALAGAAPAVPAPSPERAAATFYVSPQGKDAWSGTLPAPGKEGKEGPFATPQRARDAVRALKEKGLRQPVRVLLRGGAYYLSEPLVLEPQDSGTEACPITYEAYPGEKPVLSGGRPITGWRSADGKLYTADVPEARGGKWRFRQLFVDGRREIQARTPNLDPSDVLRKGWLYAQASEDYGIILSGVSSPGDFVEYDFTIPAAGTYHVWVGYATELAPAGQPLSLKLDGRDVPLGEMPASGGWRKVAWSRVAAVDLTAGRHTMRWEIAGRSGRILHFDAFLLTDNPEVKPAGVRFAVPAAGENRVVVQAETRARTGGRASHVGGFRTFKCEGAAYPESRSLIHCAPGTVRESWARARGAEVHIFAAWGWFNETARLVELDAGAGTLRLEGGELQGAIWQGNRFFVSNVLEELDAPGEWYLDDEAGRLTYYPRGKDPAQSVVVAPALDRLVYLRADVEGEARVEHIRLRGLTFTETDYTPDHVSVRLAQDAALWLENAHHCEVRDCRFVNVGGSGIRLHLDCRQNEIADNEIEQAGGSGVILTAAVVSYGIKMDPGEAAARVAPIENRITGNHIHHCGVIHKYVAGVHLDSRPASLALAPGNVVSRNHIHDMPRNGIFGFMHQGGNTFEGNRIERVLLESDDGGAIHVASGNPDTAPSVWRGNIVRDVYGAKVAADGSVNRRLGFGLYLDNATSRCTLTDNVVCRTSMGAVFLHGGQENVVENNIFVGDVVQQFFVSNYTGKMAGNRVRRNLFVATSPEAGLVKLARLTDETLAECDHNLYWRAGGEITIDPVGPLDEWRKKGYDTHSVVADPMFVDPANDDYTLKPGSPAFGLGFRAIRAPD